MTKKALRQLIAQDELDIATKKLLQYTEELGEDTWHDQAVSLAAQYESYERDTRMGNVAKNDLQVARNNIIANYLGLIQDLPATSTAIKAKPRGFREETLKIFIFFSLFVGKLILLFWISFHRQTGGLSSQEALTTAGFLIPIFVAYITAIITEAVRNRYYRRNGNGAANNSKRVRPFIVWITFAIIPIYIIAFWSIISMRARGDLDPDTMTNMLTLTESALGAYVGLIVFEMFKPKS